MKQEQITLDIIDEDPNQPRSEENPGFSPDSLAELAATIRLRGVKSPISVRKHPDVPGRYLINHGARRVRASRLAEKTTIPAYIDNDYNAADQVIENLQRNALTAREIADYIGRELARGVKKKVIAKSIGKSPAFITQHVTLLDLADPIAEAFNSGRIKDVTLVNELVTVYKQNPNETTTWLSDGNQELTRRSVKLLREFLNVKREYKNEKYEYQCENDGQEANIDAFSGRSDIEENDEGARESGAPVKKNSPKPADKRQKKRTVQVQHDGGLARLILDRRPPDEGFAWLRYEEDGEERVVDLSQVRLIALLEE